MDDRDIERILGKDLSVGTDAFREKLLGKCLESIESLDEGVELGDDVLDMLAAAGDLSALDPHGFPDPTDATI